MSIDRKQLKPYSASRPAGRLSAPSMLGVWQNELGSMMTVTSFDGRSFSGSYTSAVSEGQGPVSGTLSGTVAGDALAFTVNWLPTFASVTSWNGLILTASDELVLYTLWDLASTPESTADFWKSIGTGADMFFQVSPEWRGLRT